MYAENTLLETFLSIDTKVVKAVLAASGGWVEPAFNALLGMSDLDLQQEEAATPQPPRLSRFCGERHKINWRRTSCTPAG